MDLKTGGKMRDKKSAIQINLEFVQFFSSFDQSYCWLDLCSRPLTTDP